VPARRASPLQRLGPELDFHQQVNESRGLESIFQQSDALPVIDENSQEIHAGAGLVK
jgi:hypothetical protein